MGKKAVVIGGSNGIGLAVAKKLTVRGYHVHIWDIAEPDKTGLINTDSYTYHYCDLTDFDERELSDLAEDMDTELLFLSAGIGRVAAFENLSPTEIDKVFQINTVSAVKILHIFYDRMKDKQPFYCGIMGSIAGIVSSPLFSVYAASKAAICRLTESINIELEFCGTHNRILNISPSSVAGTKFNGGENDWEKLEDISENIVQKLFSNEELYIPKYEEFLKDVIDRYHKDPHEYGVHSYQYKMQSGRVGGKKSPVIGYLSGTFDLFHVGHLNLLKRAKQYCDYLIVGVHADASHKGKQTFIPFDERKQMLTACKYVDKVVDSCREDSDAWNLYHYDRLFVGSDYKGTERFERYEKILGEKGVEIIYFPYTQGTSSTQIRKKMLETD